MLRMKGARVRHVYLAHQLELDQELPHEVEPLLLP